MERLTIKEALEQGYTHYTIDQTDIFGTIKSLIDYGRLEHYPDNKLMLLDKNKIAFSFSADTIQDILQDYILNQDDFYCENDSLCDELAKADFDKIAELVNVGFEKRFMFPVNIELDLTGLALPIDGKEAEGE